MNPRWDIEQARREITALQSRARGSISMPSRSSASNAAKQVLVFLIPSPVQNILYPSDEPKSSPKPTAWLDAEQVWIWIRSFWGFINPFTSAGIGKGIYIDSHLWTIPVEFKASIILYVTQLGLSRLRPIIRMMSLVCLIIWAHRVDYWTMVLFYGGFLMAELDIRRTTMLKTSQSTAFKILWSTTYIVVFISGVFLAGQPERNAENTYVWSSIMPLTPDYIIEKWRYWSSWAAITIVWSTSNHRMLQCLFTNSVSQYLGRISFSLYLIHGSVIHTLGYSMLEISWKFIGEDRKETCFAVMAVCVSVVCIWWADIFTRLIDTPSVMFARWLEGKCGAESQTESKEEPAWRDASALV